MQIENSVQIVSNKGGSGAQTSKPSASRAEGSPDFLSYFSSASGKAAASGTASGNAGAQVDADGQPGAGSQSDADDQSKVDNQSKVDGQSDAKSAPSDAAMALVAQLLTLGLVPAAAQQQTAVSGTAFGAASDGTATAAATAAGQQAEVPGAPTAAQTAAIPSSQGRLTAAQGLVTTEFAAAMQSAMPQAAQGEAAAGTPAGGTGAVSEDAQAASAGVSTVTAGAAKPAQQTAQAAGSLSAVPISALPAGAPTVSAAAAGQQAEQAASSIADGVSDAGQVPAAQASAAQTPASLSVDVRLAAAGQPGTATAAALQDAQTAAAGVPLTIAGTTGAAAAQQQTAGVSQAVGEKGGSPASAKADSGAQAQRTADVAFAPVAQAQPQRGAQDASSGGTGGNTSGQPGGEHTAQPSAGTPAAGAAQSAPAGSVFDVKAGAADGTLPTSTARQVADAVQNALQNQRSELRVHLSPEELGGITIKLVSQGGSVSVSIVADSARTGQLLSSGLDALKSAMQSGGVPVQKADVTFTPQPQNLPQQHYQQPDGRGRQGRSYEQQKENGEGRKPEQPDTASFVSFLA